MGQRGQVEFIFSFRFLVGPGLELFSFRIYNFLGFLGLGFGLGNEFRFVSFCSLGFGLG